MKYNKKLLTPAILAVSIYLVSYQVPKFLVSIDRCFILETSIDRLIPFHTPAFVIYFLAFLQWLNAILITCKQETNKGYKLFSGFIIGSIIGFIIYMVFPTAINRPHFEAVTIFDKFAKFIFSVDNVINACPSFHCYCSTYVLLVLKNSDNTSNKTYKLNVIFSILVFLSTLFTKQHSIIDVPCGILLAYVSNVLASKISFSNIFEKINNSLNIK